MNNKLIGILQFILVCLAIEPASAQKVKREITKPESILSELRIYKNLKVGDKIPDLVWNLPLQTVNHPEGKSLITLNDYRGKLIILDFWATTCSACILNFPKAGKIQDSLPGRINFIAVTNEDEKKISSFFDNRRLKGTRYTFPSVIGDTVLKFLFPHKGIPHYVWIDSAGTVRAITVAERITMENVNKILNNINAQIPVKKDLDALRPLFLSEVISEDELASYSVLTKGSYDGLASGNRFRYSGTVLRGRALTNSTVEWMYLAAIRPLFEENGDRFNYKRMILKVDDSTKLKLKESASGDGTYQRVNVYNYELIVPVKAADKLYHYMLEDLNRYTDYYGRIEKLKVKCLILVRTNSEDRIKSRGGKTENSLFSKKPARINGPIQFMVLRLNDLKEISLPIIDETAYKGNVELEFSGATDLVSIKKELAAYGLDLREEYRTLNMFILEDKY